MSSRNRNRPNDDLAHLLTGLWDFTRTESPVLIRNLLSGNATATNGTPTSFALTHQSSATSALGNPSQLIQTTEATVFVEYEKRDAVNRSSGLFGVDAEAGGTIFGCHGPWNDGIVYFDVAGTTTGTTRVIASGQAFSRAMWAYSFGSRGMEIWRAGIRVASNAATPTWTSTGNTLRVGQHNSSASDLDNYYTWAISKYQLNPATIAEITSDPSKLFTRAPARIYTFPTASTAPTGAIAATTRRNTLAAAGTVNPVTGTLGASTRRDTLAASGTVSSADAVGTFAAFTRRNAMAASGIVDIITGTFTAATRRNIFYATDGISSGLRRVVYMRRNRGRR